MSEPNYKQDFEVVVSQWTPGDWQRFQSDDYPDDAYYDTIIANVDGGYGDDGQQVRYDSICVVDDGPHRIENGDLIISAPKLYDALKRLIVWLNPDFTARIDVLAERFYRETGIMGPGKSVPVEMAATQPPDDIRRAAWKEWTARASALDFFAAQKALAKARGEA